MLRWPERRRGLDCAPEDSSSGHWRAGWNLRVRRIQRSALQQALTPCRGALSGEKPPPKEKSAEAESGGGEDFLAQRDGARDAVQAAEGRREAALDTLRRAETTEVRSTAAVTQCVSEQSRLGADLDAEVSGLDDKLPC